MWFQKRKSKVEQLIFIVIHLDEFFAEIVKKITELLSNIFG